MHCHQISYERGHDDDDVAATLWQTQIPLNEDLSRYIHFKDVPSEFTRVPKTTSLGRTCPSLAKQEASFAKTCKIKWRKNPSANKALAWAEECCFQRTTSGHQHTHEVECRSSQHPALDSFFCWVEEIMCMTYSCKLYFTSMLRLARFLIWQTCQTNRLACTKYVYALLGHPELPVPLPNQKVKENAENSLQTNQRLRQILFGFFSNRSGPLCMLLLLSLLEFINSSTCSKFGAL